MSVEAPAPTTGWLYDPVYIAVKEKKIKADLA